MRVINLPENESTGGAFLYNGKLWVAIRLARRETRTVRYRDNPNTEERQVWTTAGYQLMGVDGERGPRVEHRGMICIQDRILLVGHENVVDMLTAEIVHPFPPMPQTYGGESHTEWYKEFRKWRKGAVGKCQLLCSDSHVVATSTAARNASAVLGKPLQVKSGELYIHTRPASHEVLRLGKSALTTMAGDGHVVVATDASTVYVVDLD